MEIRSDKLKRYAGAISHVWNAVLLLQQEHLPIHIHVRNADGEAKFEAEPVRLIESKGMKPKDLVLAEALVEERKSEIITKWKEVHGE